MGRKIYSVGNCSNFEIFPSDPFGSLDDFIFLEVSYG